MRVQSKGKRKKLLEGEGGLLKGKVYKNTPRTLEQLKDAIRQVIQAVNVDTLGKVFQNLEKHIQVCLDVKGDQLQHRL